MNHASLLCQRCGYELPIVPGHGSSPCPECGEGPASADPGRRIGSPWQRAAHTDPDDPSPRSHAWSARPALRFLRGLIPWARTSIATITQPLRLFDTIQLHRHASGSLLLVNATAAALALAALPLVPGPSRHMLQQLVDLPQQLDMVYAIALLCVPALVLLIVLASAIEAIGLMIVAKRRGWRVDRLASAAIIDHASIGWLAGALLVVPAACLGNALQAHEIRHGTGQMRGLFLLAPLLLPALSVFVALLAFEVLAFVGVRRCRFANRPQTEHAPATTTGASAPAGAEL